MCLSIPKRKQTISGVEIKRGADVGKTLATKVIDGRKKEEECVLADLCAAPKLFAQTKKAHGAHGIFGPKERWIICGVALLIIESTYPRVCPVRILLSIPLQRELSLM